MKCENIYSGVGKRMQTWNGTSSHDISRQKPPLAHVVALTNSITPDHQVSLGQDLNSPQRLTPRKVQLITKTRTITTLFVTLDVVSTAELLHKKGLLVPCTVVIAIPLWSL